MPLSKKHKERSRRRILDAASRLFRSEGYAGAGIDSIMEAAELTRGAFYAHFSSKSELFTVVAGMPSDLLVRLKLRGDRHTHHLVDGAVDAIRELFRSDEDDALQALAADAARSGIETKFSYAQAVEEVAEELVRGFERQTPGEADDRALAVLALAVGARTIAGASSPDPIADGVVDVSLRLAEAILRGDVELPAE